MIVEWLLGVFGEFVFLCECVVDDVVEVGMGGVLVECCEDCVIVGD